jgi:secondary thiamine-phosphate synthase enzyme
MEIIQKSLTLKGFRRGFHLITKDIEEALPELKDFYAGMLNIFIRHTSASLTINENADPSVRSDLENYFTQTIPDGTDYFEHTDEGADDMTAHVKASILGASISVPVIDGRLALGTWQGIYLCEHRNNASPRKLVLTFMGAW